MKHGIATCTPEKLFPESIIQIRNLAKSLKTPLSDHNVHIPHVSLLHVVSKAFGYENYNTAQALLGKTETKSQRNKNITMPARTSGNEYFDRFMDAIREQMGDGMFEYVMKVHDYTNPDGNPMETLTKYGFTTYDRLASICVEEFKDLHIEFFDVTKEGYEAFYTRFPFKENLVILDGEEEVVLCVIPSKNEKRKQIIVALDRFMYLANIPPFKVKYLKNDNFKERLSRYTESNIEWYEQLAKGRKLSLKRFNPKKILSESIPTEQEANYTVQNTIAAVKRSLLLSGVSTQDAGRLADWCVRFLGLSNIELERIVSEYYSFEEYSKFNKDTSGTIANENAEMYIFAYFIAVSSIPIKIDEWKKYVTKKSAKEHIKRLLNDYSGMRFISKDLEVIFQKDVKDAYGLLCNYTYDEIDKIRFAFVGDALKSAFDSAAKILEEECSAFLSEDEIVKIFSVLWSIQQNAIHNNGPQLETINFASLKEKDNDKLIFNKNQIVFLQQIKQESLLEIFYSGRESFVKSITKSLPDLIEVLHSEKNIEVATE
ncbi:MAG: hypothetical protein PHW18_10775 [Sulfuricurvum sp.]|uniref:hypothetical protein n=1 Tax=Sulfuricurvum sp. TaxID=2025608 RepID=UPI0026020925|nr:hypothetical protein [Sulfuricurvum sp.]MDD2830046.1 hypothetical protein [Sulfuricurvum sp.]MDD4948367.1 hypothetical protein [Sulfuricurvum sp.]